MAFSFCSKFSDKFIGVNEYEAILPQVKAADAVLTSMSGPGNDFLGWLTLPQSYDKNEFARIKASAAKIRSDSEVLVVIGIGGSYLGARAALEFLYGVNYNLTAKDRPQIFFAGCNISPSYMSEILALCEGREVSLNVVSKSGTTLEPAAAFRVFRDMMYKKYGEAASERIYVTTDRARGALKREADEKGYEAFVIPDDIGGRYSVLTAAGLLPMAVAGADIDAVMAGAADAMRGLCADDYDKNPCFKYAAARNILYNKGLGIEVLVGFEPDFVMMGEWFKQLFGESEGKDGKGIFPASVNFSADLHSMGQYIQQGRRNLFETVVWFKNAKNAHIIPRDDANLDGLNYVADRDLHYVNGMAFEGTMAAHNDGGVPCLILEAEAMDEKNFGYMVYFFEKACAISGYMLGVNPFDQPGVEFYKKNMFSLLGKPGV